jgi:hypothetical protein
MYLIELPFGRMLMIECAVETCAARERCCNQRFLRRQYPQLAPQRVAGRGWGLHTLQDIQAGMSLGLGI